MMQIQTKTLIAIILSAIALIVTTYYFQNKGNYSDETIHMEQIQRFHNGDYTLNQGITTLPGFHYIMSFFATDNIDNSVSRVRIANMIFGIITFIIFALLAKIHYQGSDNKIFQFAFLPILFPFWGFVYTDGIALLLTLLSLLLLLNKRYYLSGLFILLSMFIRQVNIIWAALFGIIVLSNSLTDNWEKPNKKTLLLLDLIPYIIIGIAFIVFYILNDGVAVGDRWAHSGNKLFMANVYFFLFIHFICFLPMHVSNFNRICSYIKKNKIFSISLFILFIFLAIRFNANHPYNHIFQELFLRNKIIELIAKNGISRIVFFLIILYTVFSLLQTALMEKKYYFLYFFTVVILVPARLVEYRYYIIPICLFILFKKEATIKIERINSAYLAVLSGLSMYFIYQGSYFP